MAQRIRPLHDRLIVKRLEEQEQKSVGGIIIPDTAKEKPQEGKVVAVGPGRNGGRQGASRSTSRSATASCSAKYSGNEIKIDGEEHLIMREEDVLGIVEG